MSLPLLVHVQLNEFGTFFTTNKCFGGEIAASPGSDVDYLSKEDFMCQVRGMHCDTIFPIDAVRMSKCASAKDTCFTSLVANLLISRDESEYCIVVNHIVYFPHFRRMRALHSHVGRSI